MFSKKHLGCVVCKHVFLKQRPVLLVTHFENGDWSFSCGWADHSPDDEADGEFFWVGVGHVTDDDVSLHGISDLRIGWSAERPAIGTPWHRFSDPDG